MIGIINYGMGNLASVQNALNHLNMDAKIIDNPKMIDAVDKLILPGVGAFKMAMDNLDKLGFSDEIREAVLVKQKPILGICLGMQLLLSKGFEHGEHDGLGLVKGEVLDFNEKIDSLPVPHIGWNDVELNSGSLIKKDDSELTFYFVHSFYCELDNRDSVLGVTDYGIKFDSMLEQENVFGCQFHPEKSQKAGMRIFRGFDKV